MRNLGYGTLVLLLELKSSRDARRHEHGHSVNPTLQPQLPTTLPSKLGATVTGKANYNYNLPITSFSFLQTTGTYECYAR